MSNEILTIGETKKLDSEDRSQTEEGQNLSGVEESEGPPHFTLKVYNNCYSLFSSSQGVENDPEVLFSKQPELFDEPLNIFLAQIQAHFGIQNDVTLFLPSLDLHFPINMTFTQQLSLGDLYAIHCEVCSKEKIFEGELIVEKYNFVQQYTKLLEQCKKAISQSEVQSIPDIQSTLPINDSGVDVLDYSKQDILQETKDHLEGTVRTSASIQESAISMASPERNKNTIESVASISNIPSTKTEILEDNTNNISHIQGEVTEVMSHSEQEQQYLGKPEEPLKSEQEQEQTDEQEDEAIRYELNQQAIKDSIQQEVGPVSDEEVEVDVGKITSSPQRDKTLKENLSTDNPESFPEISIPILPSQQQPLLQSQPTQQQQQQQNILKKQTKEEESIDEFSTIMSVVNSQATDSHNPETVSIDNPSTDTTEVENESELKTTPSQSVHPLMTTNGLEQSEFIPHDDVHSSAMISTTESEAEPMMSGHIKNTTEVFTTSSHTHSPSTQGQPEDREQVTKIDTGENVDNDNEAIDILSITNALSQQNHQTEVSQPQESIVESQNVGQKRRREEEEDEESKLHPNPEKDEDDIQHEAKRARLTTLHLENQILTSPEPEIDPSTNVNSPHLITTNDVNVDTDTTTIRENISLHSAREGDIKYSISGI